MAAAIRNAEIRGMDIPSLRYLQKRLPIFVEIISKGRDSRSYRRFYVPSTYDNFYYCYIPAEERAYGYLPIENESLVLHAMHNIRKNENSMEFETVETKTAIAKQVTYSAPDPGQVARISLEL